MPKLKTHRGAKKRFKITGKGKIKAARAFTSHRKIKKSAKRKRNLRKNRILNTTEAKKIKKFLST